MSGTSSEKKPGLETLLQLDGEIFPMDNGYWVKFAAHQVKPDKHIPHGIRYSLTLHDPKNRRILGYDNAHAIKMKRKRFRCNRTVWDHKHDRDQTTPYDFEGPLDLIQDFWNDVNNLIP